MEEIILDATEENISTATDFVSERLEAAGCDFKLIPKFSVVIDEIFCNIANYAYEGKKGQVTVRFEIKGDPSVAEVTFIDRGVKFNPLEAPEPDTTLSVDERPIGGLGIFIVKKTMDEVSYEYKDGQNIFVVRKKL